MMPQPFVIFGYNHFTCDIAEIIQERGDWVDQIVVNRPEKARLGRPTLEEWRVRQKSLGGFPEIKVTAEADFAPQPSQRFVMGFSGAGQEPWITTLRERFSCSFSTIVHPSAVVSRSAVLGAGCVVGAGAIVAAEVRISDHVTLNRGCTLGHHCIVDSFAVIQPGANVASFVSIGKGAFVGLGASVLQDRSLGEFSQVAAGAAVLADVPPRTLVAGVPAVFKRLLSEAPAP